MATLDIIHCLIVNGSLVLLLVIPLLLPACVLLKDGDWPELTLCAMTLGCSMQAAVGLIWSHTVKGNPRSEMLVFAGLCLLISLWAVIQLRRRSAQQTGEKSAHRSHILLMFILVAAFCVRCIHPLQVFYLGQSDAYTHLHYLNYIVEQGFLANIVYPSGYHWILALPALVMKIDPYLLARFSGAFFGVGLVLGIYVFLYKLFHIRAALFGSFCAACFPPMTLLMKTGVGSFANQFGLFLVPVLLYSYILLLSRKKHEWSFLLFPAASLGIAASVPMMFIHILIIIGLERIFSLYHEKRKWFGLTLRIFTFCLPAVLLIAFHFSQSAPGQRFQTAYVLVNYGDHDSVVTKKVIEKVSSVARTFSLHKKNVVQLVTNSPYFKLLTDFISVKRLGFSNPLMDTMSCILLVLYFIFLGLGLRYRNRGLLILGIWGALTTMQAATGFLQFSSYQREGWSLLIATCCLAGVVSWYVYDAINNKMVIQTAVGVGVLGSLFLTLLHPPVHPYLQSSAEDMLIRTVRALDTGRINTVPGLEGVSALLDRTLPVILVSRKFVGWSNQGEIIPNVLSRDSVIQTELVNARQGIADMQFQSSMQYVVLIDKEKQLTAGDRLSAFAMVSRTFVEGVLQQQRALYRANALLLAYLKKLDMKKWQMEKVELSADLTVYVVRFRTGVVN